MRDRSQSLLGHQEYVDRCSGFLLFSRVKSGAYVSRNVRKVRLTLPRDLVSERDDFMSNITLWLVHQMLTSGVPLVHYLR